MEVIEGGGDVAWLEDAFDEDESLVGGNIPMVFESYARILHPPKVRNGPLTTWAELAESVDVEMRPTVRWSEVADKLRVRDPAMSVRAPETGRIPAGVFEVLVELLSKDDPVDWYVGLSTGRTWFRGGDGTASPSDGLAAPAVPWNAAELATVQLRIPGREYALVRGQVTSAEAWREAMQQIARPFLMPDIMWPITKEWFVAVGVDFDSTLIGGPKDLMERLRAVSRLEVLQINPRDSLSEPREKIRERACEGRSGDLGGDG